jgi:hypothetical protein
MEFLRNLLILSYNFLIITNIFDGSSTFILVLPYGVEIYYKVAMHGRCNTLLLINNSF